MPVVLPELQRGAVKEVRCIARIWFRLNCCQRQAGKRLGIPVTGDPVLERGGEYILKHSDLCQRGI